ncbi:MAG: CBS domain-containing protein [Planctomycetota bacterium]
MAGILTETDMLRRVVRNGKDFYRTKLSQIMSSPVEGVQSNLSVLGASEVMGEKRIKRLPIVDEGRLVGIVTQTDLVRALTSYGLWRDVSEIMNRNVAGIQTGASVAEAAEIMTSGSISCVVILDGDKVAGILTQKDLLGRVVALKRDPARVKIEAVMSSPVTSISAGYSVFSASKIMEEMNVRRLVVMRGEQLCGVVTQTDIFTALREKLQVEEERNFSLLEESKNNIYTTDLDGVITYVNPAFRKLLEVSDPAELVGQPFLPKRFWFNLEGRRKFQEDLRNRSTESRELTLKTAGGQKLYVTVFSSLTRDIHGRLSGSQGIVYDITAKKELVALREAEEELAKLNQDLESAVAELSRANKELREFAYIVAHDLKTPLRAIGTLTDWISTDYADKFDEQGKEQVRLLISRAKQMSALIDDVLQYSRLGQKGETKQRVNLNLVLSEVMAAIGAPENIEIIVENELPSLRCDRTQAIQIFQNLLSNAVKYMDKPRGQIKVGCLERDDSWEFSVSDNGPGIEQRHFERIFKLFQTLSPREGVDSTGIGLSIVRKITELNSGRTWVQSEVGKGSTFFFTLPKVIS